MSLRKLAALSTLAVAICAGCALRGPDAPPGTNRAAQAWSVVPPDVPPGAVPEGMPRFVPREIVSAEQDAVLPVRWIKDVPFVTVRVDGRGPFTFVLDTGSTICVVDPRVAEDSAGELHDFRIVPDGHDPAGPAIERWLRIRTLAVGPVEFRDLHAAVHDFSTLSRVASVQVDGILGYGAFWGGLVTIDYPKAEVRVSAGSLPDPDGAEILRLESPLNPFLVLDLGYGPDAFVIDSGSTGDIRLREWPPGASFRSAPVANHRSTGFDGVSELHESGRLVARAAVGRHVIRDPVVRLSPKVPLLGSGLLRHFRLTLDPARSRVRFERDATGDITSDPIHGIGARPLPVEDGWVLADLVPGGPSERAGLREGDRLLEIDGRPLGRLLSEDAQDLLTTPRSLVRLAVLRDGRALQFEVTVAAEVP